MKQQPISSRPALGLLLAAAALPLAPLAAQEAQPPVDQPAAEQTAPPAAGTATPAPAPEPVTITPPAAPQVATPAPAPAAEDLAPAAEAAPARRTAAARTIRAAPAPAPVAGAPAPVAAPAADVLPVAEAPAALPPEALPPPEELPVTAAEPTTRPAAAEEGGGSILPWLLLAALAAGALFFFLRRRRRAADVYDERLEERYDSPVAAAPMAATAAEPAPVIATPLMMTTHQVDQTPEVAEKAAPVAAAAETGRPQLDIALRPVRAGVAGNEAIVEFALDVQNEGSAPARDVRISTWMFQAGAAQESEMEHMLIERGEETGLPETTIDAGAGKRIETSVALPTSGVQGDAVLPVVVAEARYRLPDGSEARTSARYAVGVPDGEELAHFAIANPSGLHEGVEARPLGEVERA